MKLQECSPKEIEAIKEQIAIYIKSAFDFNGYDMPREKLKDIVEIIFDLGIINKLGENNISTFFTDLRYGKYGMLYKSPSDLIAKFYKYSETSRTKLSI